jgi:hypothetical protein
MRPYSTQEIYFVQQKLIVNFRVSLTLVQILIHLDTGESEDYNTEKATGYFLFRERN